MKQKISIDFVSDISCLWCTIGYKNLQQAINNLNLSEEIELEFHPFELNPSMKTEGQNLIEHMAEKYGNSEQKTLDFYDRVTELGNDVSFKFSLDKDTRIFNTFDAHRLLHWAKSKGKQIELKLILFKAYFTDREDPSNQDILLKLVEEVGLDSNEARTILTSSKFVDQVREEEKKWLDLKISAVPSVILGNKFMLQGAVPPSSYEEVLLDLMKENDIKPISNK